MGTPLADGYFLDIGLTAIAALTPTSVNHQFLLVISGLPTTVDIVSKTRSAMLDASLQNQWNRPEEPFLFGPTQGANRPGRVDPGFEKSFVGVDVSDSCHEMLVEQERFHLEFALAKPVQKRVQIVVLRERLQAQLLQES